VNKKTDAIFSALGARHVASKVAESMDTLVGRKAAQRRALVEQHMASEHLFAQHEDGPPTSLRDAVSKAGKKTETYAAAKLASKKYRDTLAASSEARNRGDTKSADALYERAQDARLEYEKAKAAHWKAQESRLQEAHAQDTQTGKRGGKFHYSATGSKIYEK
jgi:hypothetical protein